MTSKGLSRMRVAPVLVALCLAAAALFLAGTRTYAGTSWSPVSFPQWVGGSEGIEVTAATGLSKDDTWAVGYHEFKGPLRLKDGEMVQALLAQTLTEHWNGNRWVVIPSVNPHPQYVNELTAVSEASASDVWSVGWSVNEGPILDSTRRFPLVEHWNGTSWSMVPFLSFPGSVMLTGVSAQSMTDVWVSGISVTTSGFENGVLAHWNGSSWVQIPEPPANELALPTALYARSSTQVVVIGQVSGGFLAEQWSLSGWQQIPIAMPAQTGVTAYGGDTFFAISGLSGHDVWVAGEYNTQPIVDELVKGHLVARTPSLPHGDHVGAITGIAVESANSVWATGWGAPQQLASPATTASAAVQPLLYHWDGTAWSLVAGALTPSTAGSQSVAAAVVASGAVIWVFDATGVGLTVLANGLPGGPWPTGLTVAAVILLFLLIILAGVLLTRASRRRGLPPAHPVE